eukprot:m.99036 g.99036  ORF g.99036 m.99036 type:complete len:1205 (-) comp8880_c0_seq1:56-3670(-)
MSSPDDEFGFGELVETGPSDIIVTLPQASHDDNNSSDDDDDEGEDCRIVASPARATKRRKPETILRDTNIDDAIGSLDRSREASKRAMVEGTNTSTNTAAADDGESSTGADIGTPIEGQEDFEPVFAPGGGTALDHDSADAGDADGNAEATREFVLEAGRRAAVRWKKGASQALAEGDIDGNDGPQKGLSGNKLSVKQRTGRRARSILQRITNVLYFRVLFESHDNELELYNNMTGMWTLLGIVGSLFAAIAHIGFVQAPSWAGREGADWWMEGYAISFALGLAANLGGVFIAAFLLLYIAFAPKGSIEFSLNKILYLLVAPVYWVLFGFICVVFGFVFAARITYGDVHEVWHLAAAGLVFAFIVFSTVMVFMTAKSGSILKRSNRSIGRRTSAVLQFFATLLGYFSLPQQYLMLCESSIRNEDLRDRLVPFWTTISVVGSILGTVSYEGFWLRPHRADDLELKVELSSFYVRGEALFALNAIMFQLYAVLFAIGLLIAQLFAGVNNIRSMVQRFPWAAALPVTALCGGVFAFIGLVPFLVSNIYGRDGMHWPATLIAAGACGLLCVAAVIYFIRLKLHPMRSLPPNETRESVAKARRSSFDPSLSLLETPPWYMRLVNMANMYIYYQRMIVSSPDESRLYQRIHRCWANAAIVGALLTTLSFLSLQVFGEYFPRHGGRGVDMMALTAVLAVFANLASVVVALAFMLVMTTMPFGQLGPWALKHSHIIFLPVLLLSIGVGALLLTFPLAAQTIYPDTVFFCSIGVAAAALIFMFFVRVKLELKLPEQKDLDADKNIMLRMGETRIRLAHRRSVIDWLTRADLFVLLSNSESSEDDIERRLANLLEDLSFIAALLSLLAVDGFREKPSDALDEGSRALSIYGISAVLSLAFNLLALFMGTIYSMVLSLVPGNSLRIFIHDMRHFLALPMISLFMGLSSSLVSWATLGELQYMGVNHAKSIALYVCMAAFALMLILYFLLARATRSIIRLKTHDPATARRSIFQLENGCCRGLREYLWGLLTGWQRALTRSTMTGDELYHRMEGMWTALGVIGALMSAISFLAYQQGLGDVHSQSQSIQQLTLATILAGLTLNILGAFISTCFHLMLLFIPIPKVNSFLRQLSPIMLAPNVCVFVGSMLFLCNLPFVGKSLYESNNVYIACCVFAWGLGGLSILITLVIQLFRPLLERTFYRRSSSQWHDSQGVEA